MHINCTDSQGFMCSGMRTNRTNPGGEWGWQESGWIQGVLNDDTNLSCPLKKAASWAREIGKHSAGERERESEWGNFIHKARVEWHPQPVLSLVVVGVCVMWNVELGQQAALRLWRNLLGCSALWQWGCGWHFHWEKRIARAEAKRIRGHLSEAA